MPEESNIIVEDDLTGEPYAFELGGQRIQIDPALRTVSWIRRYLQWRHDETAILSDPERGELYNLGILLDLAEEVITPANPSLTREALESFNPRQLGRMLLFWKVGAQSGAAGLRQFVADLAVATPQPAATTPDISARQNQRPNRAQRRRAS